MSSSNSNLDARMKSYEPTERFMQRSSLIVRLDGRAFSKFTKRLPSPYSEEFGKCMQITAEFLTQQFNPTLVHTQSDEITMLFDYTETNQSDMLFGGRVFKIDSTLAAEASTKFNQALSLLLPDYIDHQDLTIKLPTFDARSYLVPNRAEATNVFLWRAQDCVRNSIQMLARNFYSQARCHKKSTKDLLTMLDQDGINWADYPDHFREGSYYRKRKVEVQSEHNGATCMRNRVQRVPYHKFSSYVNRLEVVFNDEAPRRETQGQDLLNGVAPFSA